MAFEAIGNMAKSLVNGSSPSVEQHPFDPLSKQEINRAVEIIRAEKGDQFYFNAVTLLEPRKAEMVQWLKSVRTKTANGTNGVNGHSNDVVDQSNVPNGRSNGANGHTDGSNGTNRTAAAKKPKRMADVVVIGKGSKVYDGWVDLEEGKVVDWAVTEGVQPLITMEDLRDVEHCVRTDPGCIKQCEISGIPASDMHKVYCDPWAIGFDERFGSGVRLQQALMYYRPHEDDSQYSYPLDFCPIYNSDEKRIIHIDVPEVRRPVSKAPSINFHASETAQEAYRTDLKPMEITQPEGVSFSLKGREITWQNWSLHIGFNYREGIVLNNVSFYDKHETTGDKQRSIFYRLSLVEMVVPYGNPEFPHHRKHAFDLGEYGAGYMTNSLSLGCDCKGSIQYLDADFVNRAGQAETIKNAICIHEEDDGILYKHTDFRDNACTVVRARKLMISQVFTAANYEYCVYWILHQDGTIQLEIKLTGILNTYTANDGEDIKGWGTIVYPNVNAHNHQHLFCLRINPNIDGENNTVFMSDATASEAPVGSKENFYGNGFYAKKIRFEKATESMTDYDPARTWDMVNENKLNPYSGKPVGYKLVSREVPKLLPKEGSLVWKRAGFARHAVHVTPYADDQIYPAGRHVPQTSGDKRATNLDLPSWIEANPDASIANTDVVLWHTFGVTHFPTPEDFPVMPAEPMSVLLRPRNMFTRNPCLDVKPSSSSWPSQIKAGAQGFVNKDTVSRAV